MQAENAIFFVGLSCDVYVIEPHVLLISLVHDSLKLWHLLCQRIWGPRELIWNAAEIVYNLCKWHLTCTHVQCLYWTIQILLDIIFKHTFLIIWFITDAKTFKWYGPLFCKSAFKSVVILSCHTHLRMCFIFVTTLH